MDDSSIPAREILVVGAGMSAHRFVERLLRDPGADVRVTVIGDEEYGPYDRSALVDVLSGADTAALQLDRSVFRDDRVRLIRDDRVLHLDPRARTVRTRSRRTYSYDRLVLATGAYAARVAVDGARLPGCFVLRTIEDAESVRSFVDARSRSLGRPLRAAVIGGGLQGVEAATVLHGLGLGVTVVQYPDRLLSTLLDPTAAGMVQSAVERLGIAVRTRTRTTRLDPDESGAVTALEFQDGTFLRADVVVFTVGVRPRDELARNAGLHVHPLGGVLVDDGSTTSDPHIFAIGEVARVQPERLSAGPRRETAEVAAERLLGGGSRVTGSAKGAHRRLAGLDLAFFGDPLPQELDGTEVIVHHDPMSGTYRRLVLSGDARTLLGGVLVGDTTDYGTLSGRVGTPSSDGSHARGEQESGATMRPPTEIAAVRVSPSGGVLSPSQLMAIGRLAEAFGLRPFVTGDGIELHGVLPEQSSSLRERLREAGLASGHQLPPAGARTIGVDRGNEYPRRMENERRESPLRVESPA